MVMIGFVIRSGLLVGAVYYSRRLGIWGNSRESEKLYNEIISGLTPHVQKLENQLPFEVPALPKTERLRYLTKHYYNQGVKGTFNFIHMMPCYTGQLVKKARDKFDEFAKPPKAIEDVPSVKNR